MISSVLQCDYSTFHSFQIKIIASILLIIGTIAPGLHSEEQCPAGTVGFYPVCSCAPGTQGQAPDCQPIPDYQPEPAPPHQSFNN